MAIALLWVLFLLVARKTDQATRTEEDLASLDALLMDEKAFPLDLADLDFKRFMERIGIDLKAEDRIRHEENRKGRE